MTSVLSSTAGYAILVHSLIVRNSVCFMYVPDTCYGWPCSFIAAHRPPPDHLSPQQAKAPQSSSQGRTQDPELSSNSACEASASADAPPALLMKPLFISKANTALQLVFVTACLAVPAVGVPSEEGLYMLGACTVVSTIASGAAYLPMLWKTQERVSREQSRPW